MFKRTKELVRNLGAATVLTFAAGCGITEDHVGILHTHEVGVVDVEVLNTGEIVDDVPRDTLLATIEDEDRRDQAESLMRLSFEIRVKLTETSTFDPTDGGLTLTQGDWCSMMTAMMNYDQNFSGDPETCTSEDTAATP